MAVQRLLQDKLPFPVSSVELMTSKQDMHWKESPEYKIRTRYMRTIYEASLHNHHFESTGLEQPIIEDHNLEQSTPFLHSHDMGVVLYAWLEPQEFEFLSSLVGEPVLQQWLSGIHVST